MYLNNSYSDFLFRTRIVRRIFLLIYAIANIYAFMVLTDTDALIGDYQGVLIKNKGLVLYLLLLTILSYYIVCGPLFLFLSRMKIKSIPINNLNSFASILLFFQVLFAIFNIVTDSNAAGTDFQTGGIGRLLWLFMPIDYLFYIYYFLGRDTKIKKIYIANTIIFILSMISRGWLGWIMVLGYAELCFLFYSCKNITSRKKLKYFVLFFIIALLVPLAFSIKIQLRTDLSASGLAGLLSTLTNIDYIQSYNNFIAGFFSRIQQLSNIVFFSDYQQDLAHYISTGYVSHYAWEGLPQQTIAKLLGINPGVDMHVFLYSHYISSTADAVTTLQVGFISWFFLGTLSSIFYPFYVLILLVISLLLSKRIGGELLCGLTWIMIFLSIMCGWYNAYLVYLQALITFYFILGIITLLSQTKVQVIDCEQPK